MIPSRLRCARFSDLVLEVHTVGYPAMGESIVTILKDGHKVLLTVVTDSFKTENINQVKCILEGNGCPPVNIFIWTHPDEDHSVGIEGLLNEFDHSRNATVYMPANLSKEIMTCDAAKNAFDYLIENYNKDRLYQLYPVITIDDQVVILNSFEIRERLTNRTITGRFCFLLPDASLTIRRNFYGAKNPGDMNDYSIVYVLELNGMRYLFGGDMTKQSIQFVERKSSSYLENIRFVKIPHHGSTDPMQLVEMITPYQQKKAVATTTVFKSTHPYKDVIEKYETICEYVSSTDRGIDGFGCIRHDFNLSRMIVPEPVCSGNARILSV